MSNSRPTLFDMYEEPITVDFKMTVGSGDEERTVSFNGLVDCYDDNEHYIVKVDKLLVKYKEITLDDLSEYIYERGEDVFKVRLHKEDIRVYES